MEKPQAAVSKFAPGRADLTGTSVGRFAIHSRLGAGRMGEVYLAQDTKLKRSVALKRMAPELRSDERFRQRFLKEAERASLLSDFHIASVYDVLEEDNETFLVMEYVEGATLRSRFGKPLSVEEFFPLAIECAEALVAAHEKGIVHRDIKPENIMLNPKGHVKVLDFGVAKRLPRTDDETTTRDSSSGEGTVAGTPAYMAPEVLLGQEADERVDLFSVGVVFYEALTGQHPFLAEGFVQTTDRILHEEPPPVRQLNPAVPEELERTVTRLLAKDRSRRYASAIELLTELSAMERALGGRDLHPPRRRMLRRIVAAVALAAAVLVLLVMTSPSLREAIKRQFGIPEIPQDKRLAVLPFAVVSGEPSLVALSRGLNETLTARLNQLTERHLLQVVPSSEVRALNVTTVDKARKLLGINLALVGSLQEAGGVLRINYSLVDAYQRRQLRADTITAASTDPFEVEDEVVTSALSSLAIELAPPEKRALTTYGTQVAAAYDDYLRGRGFLQEYQRPESVQNAISAFRRAAALDPHFALAFAGLGEAFWRKYENTRDTEWVEPARQACEQATSLDSQLAAAQVCLGRLNQGTGNYEQARAEFQRAIELAPGLDDAYRGLALAYESLGKLDLAEATYRQAIAVRPGLWLGYNALGVFFYRHGRYAEAEEMFQRVVTLTPDNPRGHSNLGATYQTQGRIQPAIQAYRTAMALGPDYRVASNLGTLLFYYEHDYAKAAESFEQALALNDRDYRIWGNLGSAYKWAGQPEKSRAAYLKAVALAERELGVNPRDGEVLLDLANYHADLKDPARARQYLQRGLRLAGNDANLLFLAATAYQQLGDRDQALFWLRRAVDAGYSREEIAHVPELASLRQDPRFEFFAGTQPKKPAR